jgi:Recombination directionality factor-like
MAVLDIQRRGQQIGRLRMGQQVQAANGKMRPARLDTWRFTTASRVAADAIAELYGGEVRDWQRGQFEVITGKSEIGVTVPPRDEVISQWYEMWNKGGCVRRCDSQSEQISNGPCLCPHARDADDEAAVAIAARKRAEMAKLNPPQACKLVTRISVMIPDLPGLGVFRLDSGSYYAASEIGDAALLMQAARDKGMLLPAILRIEQRQRIAGGKTTSYPVPVLEVLATFRQIVSGSLEAGGIAAQLPPAPGEAPKAITAGPAAEAPAPEASPEPTVLDDDYEEPWQRATAIAGRARAAKTPNEFRACAAEADSAGLMDEQVCIDREQDEWQDLRSVLEEIWADKKRGAA